MSLLKPYSRLLLVCGLVTGLLAGCAEKEQALQNTEKSSPAPAAPAAAKAHWSYEGDTSPEHWGELEEDFETCELGKEQSPIDIEAPDVKKDSHLSPVEVDYSPSEVSLVNNGHTIQVNVSGENNHIVLEGKSYTLKQFHFHLPSEHEVGGKHNEMELHFVHKTADGEIAVLGILINGGAENAELNKLWSQLPREESEEAVAIDGKFDLKALLPGDLHSYRYHGSLTTPPCTEGVQWIVLQQPVEWSEAQIGAFRTLFPHDNRPVQPLEGRTLETEG
ncbi:carbonic anhydrase [Paenibacillus forsythiae]|uniref:carbonic anhydrase n=1 Tax=Paenibacillus forsythiae TaxID=365616 RepID=A0ABU3H875_9BACL|nr:carbonic anhydrase family protein [Paenibacillus forsythiae]MDT3427023.1 carbonic anhydrase [Paenibacillus forsythiae]